MGCFCVCVLLGIFALLLLYLLIVASVGFCFDGCSSNARWRKYADRNVQVATPVYRQDRHDSSSPFSTVVAACGGDSTSAAGVASFMVAWLVASGNGGGDI